MQVHLTRQEVLQLLLDKIPTSVPFAIDNVVITDGCDDNVPSDAIELKDLTGTDTPNEVAETAVETVGGAELVDAEVPDLFVKRSNIVDVLKKQLDAQGFGRRFPKDANKMCVEVWENLIDELTTVERDVGSRFVSDADWKSMSIIWSRYQDAIRKKL